MEMRAVGLTRFSEVGKATDALNMLSISVPQPSSGQVAIQVAVSSTHIAEINAAQGTALARFYGPKNVSKPKPTLLGSWGTGKILESGEGVEKFRIGDDVIVIPSEHPQAGSWSDYQCFGEH